MYSVYLNRRHKISFLIKLPGWWRQQYVNVSKSTAPCDTHMYVSSDQTQYDAI